MLTLDRRQSVQNGQVFQSTSVAGRHVPLAHADISWSLDGAKSLESGQDLVLTFAIGIESKTPWVLLKIRHSHRYSP
jgi:hypothetical protein